MTDEPEKQAREYLHFMNSEQEPHLGSPWENMQDAIQNDPEYAWKVILAAVRISDDDDLSLVGTGPIEQMLVQHPEYANRAIDLASTDGRFREALRSADIRGGDDQTVARLDDFFDQLDGLREEG